MGRTTYSGVTLVNAGTLQAGSITAFSPNSDFVITSVLDLNGNSNVIGSLAGSGTVTNTGLTPATLTAGGDSSSTIFSGSLLDGTGGLALIKSGTGTLTLNGANMYSGATIVSSGTLQAGSTTALSPNSAFTVNAALDLNGFSSVIGSLSGTGTVTNGGGTPATLTAGSDGTDTVFSGTLTDGLSSLALTKTGSGMMILSGSNTYSGGTAIVAGTLQLGNGGTTGSIVGNVVDNGILIFDRSDVVPFAGMISGTGSLQQNGVGTTILSGVNTYVGGTVINAGTLTVNGAQALGLGDVVVNGGILNADPQTINVPGNYTQNAGGTLQLQVAGANVGLYHTLNVGGNAALGGALQLISLGFQPSAGEQLTVVRTGGVVSGRFAQFLNPFAAAGRFNTV